jgi:hypothetical protein
MDSFEMTAKEVEAAKKHGGKFRLYLVGKCTTEKAVIQSLRNPKALFQNREMGREHGWGTLGR